MASRITYEGDGSNTLFVIPFEYLDRTHVKVKVGGVELATDAWSFATDGTISLDTAPSNGATVEVYRETPTDPLTVYQSGSVLSRDDLEVDSLQALYRVEEVNDAFPDFPVAAPLAPLVWNAEGTELENGSTDLTGDMLLRSNLASYLGGLLVKVKYGGLDVTGTVVRSLQSYIDDMLRITDFLTEEQIADGKNAWPTLDSTEAIQAALDTGKPIDFCGLRLMASGLTQTTGGQWLGSTGGIARLIKNADGVIMSSTADDVVVDGILFYGDAATPTFTGDNVTFSGNRCMMLRSGSQWAHGRAVLATGDRFRILSPSGIFQTADTDPTAFDIVIGRLGTATLYHQLENVVSTQHTGGILLIDTGSHVIQGGQIGQLAIRTVGTPGGANGGMTSGVRITGAVDVQLSSAIFTGCQFGSSAHITFAAGTSGCRLDASNVYAAGVTVTNNGNSNNFIERIVSTGGANQIKYGQDSSVATMAVDLTGLTNQWEFSGGVVLPNTRGYRFRDNAAAAVNGLSLDASNRFSCMASLGTFNTVFGGTDSLALAVNNANEAEVTTASFRPATDNARTLGTSALRWSTVYAGTGAINTSDAREKQDVYPLDDAEVRVGKALRGLIRKYRWKDAVVEEGDNARTHVGVVAQEVVAAFAAEGLDAMKYGVVTLDKWEGGERFGVRYDELFAFIIAGLGA